MIFARLSMVPWTIFIFGFMLAGRQAQALDVILCGSGGEPEYRTKFRNWGDRLKRVLIDKAGREANDVYLFMEAVDNSKEENTQTISLKNLAAFFSALPDAGNAEEPLFIYMIGHGSYLRGQGKFHIPGPDLNLDHVADWLRKIGERPIVLINAASGSAAWVNGLSGPNRLIFSATKSVGEQYATEYMEFFLQALEQGLADPNRDERVSIWEVCERAASLTETWYTSNGLIATEHGILDDNGDGLGTRLVPDPIRVEPSDQRRDGLLARKLFLKDFVFPESVPPALVQDYRQALAAIEKLKTKKESLSEKDYYQRLEQQFLVAAKIHREIRMLMQDDSNN